MLEILEFMSDAVRIPILLDGDTGYGNFNNMRRLVHKLEQREVAGVCIEDKLFPKTNSFIGGECQPLATVEEFTGKIKAAKDAQRDDDFVVVARIEAFIAGWGLKEALSRAEAYRQAGADAILVHSKKRSSADIDAFMQEWGERLPIVIVPTKYYTTPTEHFKELGIDLVIWANHNLRTCIKTMQETSRRIFEDRSLVNVEQDIASVAEVFRLQGAAELQEAEKRYLPTAGKEVNAVVLAASRGVEFGDLTAEIPKTLLKVQGKTLLERLVGAFHTIGLKDITVVTGHARDKITMSEVKTLANEAYDETKELYSLYLAKDQLKADTIISYGDIVFKEYILNDLLSDERDITVVIDADVHAASTQEYRDFAATSEPYSRLDFQQRVALNNISSRLDHTEVNGEFIGLWKVSNKGAAIVRDTLERLADAGDLRDLRISDLFNELTRVTEVGVNYIRGGWLDIDTVSDLVIAGETQSA